MAYQSLIRSTPESELKGLYDVIIIGAGVAGLVCGNYLVRSGLSVLIIEQHYLVGGCCSTYRRKNYYFDVGVHGLGGLSENGNLRKILNDIDLGKLVTFHRIDPTDVVITPEFEIPFYIDHKKTIEVMTSIFPDEGKGLRILFDELLEKEMIYFFYKYQNIFFHDYLRRYLKSEKLISVFLIFLGNIGISGDRVSTPIAVALFKNFVLDGGWYPDGGMQNFPNALAENFKKLNGHLLLQNDVIDFSFDKHAAKYVISKNIHGEKKYYGNNIVFNTSAKFLYERFENSQNKVRTVPRGSVSVFVYYIAIDNKKLFKKYNGANLWCYQRFEEVNQIYGYDNNNYFKKCDFLYIGAPSQHDNTLAPPDQDVLCVIVPARFQGKEYWIENRISWEEKVLKLLEHYFPGINLSIIHKESGTPTTIYKYTRNHEGSIYGSLLVPEQTGIKMLPNKTEFEGVYHIGHWTKPGPGVATVAKSGEFTAKQILKNKKS